MSHHDRGGGRTTRALQKALECVRAGKRVVYVVSDTRQRRYVEGVLGRLEATTSEIRRIVISEPSRTPTHLRGRSANDTVLIVDHYAAQLDDKTQAYVDDVMRMWHEEAFRHKKR